MSRGDHRARQCRARARRRSIGPAGTFASLPDSAKWLLSAAMLIGRLELFTVLVLFVPSFWRG